MSPRRGRVPFRATPARPPLAFIDPERRAASGASYGGHLVNWLLATTDRFDALMGHAGLVDLERQYSTSDVFYHRERMNGGPAWGDSAVWEEQSPSTYVGNFSTPTMLTIGERDFRVPINQTIAAWSYLQRMQVPSRLLVYHDADHWIMKGKEARHFCQEVHDWLAEHLEPEREAKKRAEAGSAAIQGDFHPECGGLGLASAPSTRARSRPAIGHACWSLPQGCR
ncbi:prolyl oligopeptidase family serine peptidase [bacterium]|nr:prolyl oligopeptidase family serine peptidase [bacterium]